MKQYDKIYITDEDGEFEAVDIDSDTPEKGRLSPQLNAIVTTLEEIKELAIHIAKQWVEETSDGSSTEEETTNDLRNYLKEKGITI